MMVSTEETATVPAPEELLSRPYDYALLTDEVCADLEQKRTENVTALLTEDIQADDGARCALTIQELAYSVASGRVAPEVAGTAIKDALSSPNRAVDDSEGSEAVVDLQDLVVDAVTTLYDDYGTLPASRIAQFLSATQIPQETLLLHIDAKLLMHLDLLRDRFDKTSIKKQTNIVYRQANFNLVREESEGFAKLMTEVFSSCTSQDPSNTNVGEAVEKVKALIGAFDLDVGRSLDVILDVFGSVLVKNFRFFVKFLRASPWWPRAAAGGGSGTDPKGLPLWALPTVDFWKLTDEHKEQIAAENNSQDTAFWSLAKEKGLSAFYHLGLQASQGEQTHSAGDDFSKDWVDQTGLVPATGNKEAAQLLGFKLRFYSSSSARDESDALPDHLMFLSALLIKIGFISLRDLFPHLWRPDDAMDQLKKQKEAEKKARDDAATQGGKSKNALTTSGALPDDTAPSASAVPKRVTDPSTRAGTPSKDSEAESTAAKSLPEEPADQKIALLKSLLAIGALPEALFIIGRFPWVLKLIPELPEYFFRILKYSLEDVAAISQPLRNQPSLQEPLPLYETDRPGVPKGHVMLQDNVQPKHLRWAQLDKVDSLDGTSYRYYYDEWHDLLPKCQTVEDVFILFETLLPLVGVKIGQDPELVTRIARIGKHSMKEDSSESNRGRWLDFCKKTLLPSISLTKANAGVVNEVFELLFYFPTKTRYLLYLEWSDGRTSRDDDVMAAAKQAKAETLDVLKRISKTNTKPMGRALAKIAYANPHIVTAVALKQIESYDSISQVFVEGSRYFTDLGYDVLTWNLIRSMARAGRSNTQDGGIFASRWLTALSRFAGDIYKRYSMMKTGPILQYVARQIDTGNTMELKLLENIVTSMAGITNDTTYNESQLQAMGGGPLLQSQTILQLLDGRHEKQATAKRLVSSLFATGLVGRFLVSMAQQRQACTYRKVEAPLKVIGNTYDEIHRVLVQYLDLLQHNVATDSFVEVIPDVTTLIARYEIRPEIAFLISRSILSKQIAKFELEKAEDASIAVREASADVDMKDEESSEEDGEAEEDEAVAATMDTPTENELLNSVADSELADGAGYIDGNERPWHPILEKVMDGLVEHLPEEVVSIIGTGFYVTFWQLALYDIAVPKKSYSDEMMRVRRKRDGVRAERVVGQSANRKKEERMQELSKLSDDILTENGQHVKASIACRKRLNGEKLAWFVNQAQSSEKLNTALWEYCFLPRILTSSLDAYFSFTCIKFLHTTATPNFRTLSFYDILFRTERLISIMFLSSAKEAEHFGRFLGELLKDLNRWHKSRTVYEKEALGAKKELPGFSTKIEAGKPIAMLSYDSYRKIAYKWHQLLHQAFQRCLKSTEYMHIRNAISVLHAVSESGAYPVVNVHGIHLQTTIDKLRTSEMQDLVTSSTSLLSALKRSEKQWVPASAFSPGVPKEPTLVASTDKRAGTPAPGSTSQIKRNEHAEGKPVAAAGTAVVPSKPEVSKETKEDAMSDNSSRLPARPGAVNGVSNREREERSSSRQGRPESSRAALPVKLSPPARQDPPANLPSRPDPTDIRGSHREQPRPSRPPQETLRPAHPRDSRDPRDVRTNYRGAEHHYEEYERLPRRYEEAPRPGGRDERGYPRERDESRAHERPRQVEREREKPSERDRPSSRPQSRERESRDRPLRESTSRHVGEEASSRPTSSRALARSDAARTTPSQPESMGVNPERAAMIGLQSGATNSTNRPAQARTERPPRTSSPRRDNDPRDRFRSDRDDRPSSDRRPEGPSSRQATPSTAPGPRSDYPSRPPRDSRPPHGGANVDMEAGRLERDNTQRPPPRPEAPAEAEIPSGPRAAGSMPAPRGRGGPTVNTRPSSQQQPPNDRQTPTGPSGRHSRAPSLSENNTSAPATPDTAGVHPSRMAQLTSPVDSTRPSLPPPAGPRGRGAPPQAPASSAPPPRGPPSGPAAIEGSGKGGRPSRSQINTLNDTLAQAAHGGSSGRGGRGGRQTSNNYPPHISSANGPPSSTSGTQDRPPPRNEQYGQNDLFATHNSPNSTPIGSRPPPTRQDSNREHRLPTSNDRPAPEDDRRPNRRHDDARDRDQRDPRDSQFHNERSTRERDNRDGRDARDRQPRESASKPTDRESGGAMPPRRDDRPSRRNDAPSGSYAGHSNNDERGGSGRGYRAGPGGEIAPPSGPGGRKHPRSEENGSGSGQYPGPSPIGGGRGAARTASESKRPRRAG